MAVKANVFTTDHERFLETLADLGHFQQLVGWQLRLATGSFKESLNVIRSRGQKDWYGAGNGMVLIDILHVGELIVRAPYGKRVTQGQKLFPMAEEMERRFNSFLLVWLFEALEKHLRVLYGKMLFQLRGHGSIPEKRVFHKRFPKWATKERTPQYFQAYAEFLSKRDQKRVIADFETQLDWNRDTYPGSCGPLEQVCRDDRPLPTLDCPCRRARVAG